jgi:hypothetical protein
MHHTTPTTVIKQQQKMWDLFGPHAISRKRRRRILRCELSLALILSVGEDEEDSKMCALFGHHYSKLSFACIVISRKRRMILRCGLSLAFMVIIRKRRRILRCELSFAFMVIIRKRRRILRCGLSLAISRKWGRILRCGLSFSISRKRRRILRCGLSLAYMVISRKRRRILRCGTLFGHQ